MHNRKLPTHHSAPIPPGTRYATLGTPMGIILISFLVEVFARGPLFVMMGLFGRDDTMPFLGTNVDTFDGHDMLDVSDETARI